MDWYFVSFEVFLLNFSQTMLIISLSIIYYFFSFCTFFPFFFQIDDFLFYFFDDSGDMRIFFCTFFVIFLEYQKMFFFFVFMILIEMISRIIYFKTFFSDSFLTIVFCHYLFTYIIDRCISIRNKICSIEI